MNQRVQVDTNFQKQRLQTQARPGAVTAQVPQDVNASAGFMALANAFAKGEMLMEQNQQQQEQDDRAAAQKWASSMTVKELNGHIKEGRMLPSQSPVFAATVQHIWGDNAREAEERDLLSRLQTGELKFNSAEEIDQYLTESRNTALAGQSKYASAGFGKGYGNLRTKLMDAVTKQVNGEQVEYAANQATTSMMNGLKEITSPDFKGDAAEGAKVLMQRYDLMHKTAVLPDSESRKVLTDLVVGMSAQGNTALLSHFLNQEVEGVGTVRTMLGEAKAQTLMAQSGTAFDQVQRQRVDDEAFPYLQSASRGELDVDAFTKWGQSDGNKKYTSSSMIQSIINQNAAAMANLERERQAAVLEQHSQASIADAQKKTEAALSDGEFWRVNGQNKPQVITANGAVKDFDAEGYATQALEKATKELPMDQQVSSWALNGITNPDWKNRIRAGFFNLSTIGVDAQGKPVGQLNAEGQASIELFRQLNQVNPEYAKQVAGDAEYKRFSDIEFLQYMGRDVHTATGIAMAAASGATTNAEIGNMTKKIRAKANDLLDHPFSDLWSRWIGKENVQHNTQQVASTLRRLSELLAHGGQYGSADAAVDEAAKYLSNEKVSVMVNGTLYLRSEIPQPPGTKESQEDWLKRFIDNGPKKLAKEALFDSHEVRLEFDGNTKAYRVMTGELPLWGPNGGPLTYTKADIQEWYAMEYKKDLAAAVAASTDKQRHRRHGAYQDRLSKELRELQGEDKYVLERYDTTANGAFFSHNIYGEAAFRRIEKDGNADKALRDLMQLYPSKRKK